MAKIKSKGTITIDADFNFNEKELRALNAMVCYGEDAFLKAFYEQLGTTYLKPYEEGMRSIFKVITGEVPRFLARLDGARARYENDQ